MDLDRLYPKEKQFLRDIYTNTNFSRHGLCCVPEPVGITKFELGDFTISERPVEDWLGWAVKNYEDFVRFHEAVGDDSVPYVLLNTGTHIYAAAFGAKIHIPPDDAPCALPFVNSPEEADAVKEADLWKSPTLYRIFELAGKIRDRLGDEVCISVPDMQSGFDTAALIWNKEDMLCSMLTDPEAVKRLVEKCARLFKTFLVEFRREFPNSSPCHCPLVWAPPDMGPWLSNDECGLFDTRMFREFCLPELVDLTETFGGLGMHCCADAEHQFETFKTIPGFYGFNRVAGRRGYKSLLEHFHGEPDEPALVLSWIEDEDVEMLIRNSAPGVRYIFNKIGGTPEEARAWYGRFRELSDQTGG